MRIADRKHLPFTVKASGSTAGKSMKQLVSGHSRRFDNANALFQDLGIWCRSGLGARYEGDDTRSLNPPHIPCIRNIPAEDEKSCVTGT